MALVAKHPDHTEQEAMGMWPWSYDRVGPGVQVWRSPTREH